ncbi:unnamed protein product [Gongylonema pulchrum]|uniref:Uncharacterized protein n=1 Tax=Gongylonema pulchrum TaxID=637853 RepID=A0A3P6QRD7_9BILA|nr:unnamed protein product [Gongylonema pulchrum]
MKLIMWRLCSQRLQRIRPLAEYGLYFTPKLSMLKKWKCVRFHSSGIIRYQWSMRRK